MCGLPAPPPARGVPGPRRRLGDRAGEVPVGLPRRSDLALARARLRRARAVGPRGDRYGRRGLSAVPAVGRPVREGPPRPRTRAGRRPRGGQARRAVASARRPRRRHLGGRRAAVPERASGAARGGPGVLRRPPRAVRGGAGDGAVARPGQARPRPRDREVAPGLRVVHTPGHTPGHRSIVLESGAERVLITGDLLHIPVQAAHPEWPSSHDEDPRPGRLPGPRSWTVRRASAGASGSPTSLARSAGSTRVDGGRWVPARPGAGNLTHRIGVG